MENIINLEKLVKILKRNVKVLIVFPILFIIISILITFFLVTPKYGANTQVLVNQKSKNNELMAQEVQSNIQLTNTYSQIVESPRILDEVAKKEKDYSSSDIKNMLTVTSESNSQILNINVKNSSKHKSEEIANTIATIFSKEMTSIMNVDNVSILSKADGTATQITPKPILNIFGGLIVGLILSLIIILLKETLDKRIKSEEDVEIELDIPVLGSIPKLK